MRTRLWQLLLAVPLFSLALFASGCAATGYYGGYEGYYDEPAPYYYGPDFYGGAPYGFYRFDIHPRYWDRDDWHRHHEWEGHGERGRWERHHHERED